MSIPIMNHYRGSWYTHIWLGLQKSTFWVQKKCQFSLLLLYHNLMTIYITTSKPSSLLQNLMGFLLQLTQSGFYILNGTENITLYNLRSHGQFLQARSHIRVHIYKYTRIHMHNTWIHMQTPTHDTFIYVHT